MAMRSRRMTRLALTVTVMLAGAAVGCGGSGTIAVPGEASTPVEQVARLLRTAHEQNKPSPKSLKDAEKFAAGLPDAIAALKSGEVVIYWGVNLDEYGGGSLIGYEKKTPEQGGIAILGDGTTTDLTPDLFKTIPPPPDSKLKPASR